MFDKNWRPHPRFKVIVPVPWFRRPPPKDNHDWYRKFLLSMLRLFNPKTGSLDTLEALDNDELQQLVDEVFKEGTLSWILEILSGETVEFQPHTGPVEEPGREEADPAGLFAEGILAAHDNTSIPVQEAPADTELWVDEDEMVFEGGAGGGAISPA